MFLPGAYYVIVAFIGLAGGVLCAYIGLIIGSALSIAAEHFLKKSKIRQKMVHGHEPPKGGWPWWVYPRKWSRIGFVIGSFGAAYCLAGPVHTLVKYLGR